MSWNLASGIWHPASGILCAMNRVYYFILILVLASICCSGKKQSGQPKVANNPVAEIKQADQLLIHKRCSEAVPAYQKFLEKYPKDAQGWNSLGIAYLCDSKFQEAVPAFEKAIVLAPTYSDVHNNLGIAYMELKNNQQARAHFLKALEDPQYPKVGPYYNLSKLAYIEQNYEESRALAKKVLEFSPKETAPRLVYAFSLEKLNRFDEASAQFKEILKTSPDNVEACYHLATVLKQQNLPCEAKEYYRKVIDADPLSDFAQKSIAAIKVLYCPKASN
jgi:type IV pilus assembly protein PilF